MRLSIDGQLLMKMHQLRRYWSTIKYLRWIQIYSRMTLLIKKHLLHRFMVRRINRLKAPKTLLNLNLTIRPFPEVSFDATNYTFSFLNHRVTFGRHIRWNDPAQQKLWLYHLHYFDYLLPLAVKPKANQYSVIKVLMQNWMEENPTGSGNGWEPYPLSLRLVNWIYVYDRYRDFLTDDADFNRQLTDSIYRQAAYLRLFLEYHLQANHLWANIKAMIWAAVFFGHRQWFNRFVPLLHEQLREQILEDGGHYERSPMYHAIILHDMIDLLQVLNNANQRLVAIDGLNEVRAAIEQKIPGVLHWLRAMLYNDEQFALWGDSAYNMTPSYNRLKNYSQAVLPKQSLPLTHSNERLIPFATSGYYVFIAEQQKLIFDTGPLGVPYQPGHVHGDLLSFTYACEGQPMIVDTGVGTYLPDALRNTARSVSAHNTMVVNDMDQAEFWAAFRVGRRVEPEQVNVGNDDLPAVTASYQNQLSRREAYRHQRRITCIKNRFFLIEDYVTAKSLTSAETLLHLHPSCRIAREQNHIRITRAKTEIVIIYDHQHQDVQTKDWFYVPEFGEVLDNKVLIFNHKARAALRTAFIISPVQYLSDARQFWKTTMHKYRNS
ncbi:MAG: hypothetical protein GF313_11200 [Caldithrix sp.]|nr:hypothetical protein [Caldithrix sp.]